MIRKLWGLVAIALCVAVLAPAAWAQNCTSYPYTLTNGQTADANQVMANFNNILNCANNNLAHNGANSDITSLSGLTTPLSVAQGGTGAATLGANGVLLGNGTSAIAVAAPSTAGYVLTDNGVGVNPSFQAASPPLAGYIFGVTISNNVTDPTNDLDIAVGAAADNTSGAIMTLAAGLTKQTDNSWAVGTGAGCLDTGVVGNNSYHIFLIQRSDTSVTDVLCSLSATAPTMPANYDRKRRIASIVRSGGAVLGFSQNNNQFLWTTVPTLDINTAAPGTSVVTAAVSVPVGVKMLALMNVYSSSGALAYFHSPDQSDQAPSGTATPLFNVGGAPGTAGGGGMLQVRTNTSAQIQYRMASNNQIYGVAYGWVDDRGQYATP